MKHILGPLVALCAFVGVPAQATYVKYDLTTYSTGKYVDYFQQSPSNVVLYGTYSLVFDLGPASQLSSNYYYNGSILDGSEARHKIDLGSITTAPGSGGRSFNLSLAAGALNSGYLSSLKTADILSSIFSYSNGAHHQAETFQPGVVTSISTQFSETAFATPLGLTIVREIIAPVPEPATWAMMLIGFGGIGYAIRRTRKRAVSFS